METRTCLHCGKEFQVPACRGNKYCSYDCYWDAMKESGLKRKRQRKIDECAEYKLEQYFRRIRKNRNDLPNGVLESLRNKFKKECEKD